MPNTVTNTRLLASKTRTLQYVCIDSDGTEETDLVVYDSSDVSSTLGVTDPLSCKINQIYFVSNSKLGVFHLEWDASTDVLALPLPNENPLEMDFRPIGGLKNTAGSGITGDITFTSTGLVSGDKVMLILDVAFK